MIYKIGLYLACIISTLRLVADNCYKVAQSNLDKKNVYSFFRYIEAASVLNPSSIITGQAEIKTIANATPGQRLLFFHPNDYDALIIRTEELRRIGNFQEARKYLFKAAKSDPYYSQANNTEMSMLK